MKNLTPIDPQARSLARRLLAIPKEKRIELIANMPEEEALAIMYDWQVWARDEQLWPDGPWTGWLTMTGRGWGKTRTGAEFVRDCAKNGHARRIGLIARTAADGRDVMVEGESGIMNVHPSWDMPLYEPTKRRITFRTGAIGTIYSADEPDLLRGPQHDLLWMDEIASWRFRAAWDNAMFGLRLGERPRWVATTTPKTVPLILELLAEARPAKQGPNGIYVPTSEIVVTTGSVYDNIANLPETFIKYIIAKYEGTRLGIQELYGELLKDDPSALWKRDRISELRVTQAPLLRRVVIGVDPAASATETSSDTGIIAAGVGIDGRGYVLDDKTIKGLPHEWARKVVAAYHEAEANMVVAETNHGGDMVIATILTEDRNILVKKVTASRGKIIRAEPIANLYEKGLVSHVGHFPHLEDQMCTYVPGDDHQRSPDRMDALVWALTELMVDIKHPRYGTDYGIF